MMEIQIMMTGETRRRRTPRFAAATTVLLILFSLPVTLTHAQDSAEPAKNETSVSIEPVQALQAAINRAIGDDVPARDAAVAELKAAATQDAQNVVRQMLVFHSGAKTTRQAMAFGGLMRELSISRDVTVRALTPVLDSEDARLTAAACGVLAEFEDQSALRPPDFSLYREIIAEAIEKKETPPQGLVAHMFEVDAGAALLTMMRSHRDMTNDERKVILWAEHVVADMLWKQRFGFLPREQAEPTAIAEIKKMARHPAWWARLYAAEMMRQHAALSNDQIADTLRQDANELVRRSADAIPSKP